MTLKIFNYYNILYIYLKMPQRLARPEKFKHLKKAAEKNFSFLQKSRNGIRSGEPQITA